MKREFLEDLGVKKEDIDKILDENSADIGKAKGDYDDVNAKYEDAAKQLKTAGDTIKELKRSNTDNESLQKTIAEHEATIKQLQEAHATELKGIKVDTAITKLLTENNAKYPELLSGKFDREKLRMEGDGTVTGLTEQFKSIKETYGDMFGKAVSGKTPENPDAKPSGGGGTFEALVKSADSMTADEVAAQFAAMEKN